MAKSIEEIRRELEEGVIAKKGNKSLKFGLLNLKEANKNELRYT